MHRVVLAITLLVPGVVAAAPDPAGAAAADDLRSAPVAQADDPEQPPLGPTERGIGTPGGAVVDETPSAPPPYYDGAPSPNEYRAAPPYGAACPTPPPCYPAPSMPSSCCGCPCGGFAGLQPRYRPGWNYVVDADGSWWRERQVKKGNGGLIAGGLILWLGTYAATAYGGIFGEGLIGLPSLVPLAGPFFSAAWAGADGNGGAAALYVLSGLTQISGFIMLVAGASQKKLVLERQRVTWGAAVIPGGAGSSVTVRF